MSKSPLFVAGNMAVRAAAQVRTAKKSLYRTILQNIVCTRHADLSSAYAEIDMAFQANQLKEDERRQLSYMARAHYEFWIGEGRSGCRGPQSGMRRLFH